jgi:diguanylate cyclase (GGDEF)-like protein/PAS domain S-box-containing protein
MQKETILPYKSVLAVTWPCVVIVGVLLIISAISIVTLSATRAYVAGNSLWTRAEREISSLLIAYRRTGNPEMLAELNAQMNVLLGDRTARLELVKSRPNDALARRGLLAGGNHPDDIQSMIWLFRAARLLGLGEVPLRIWGEADEQFLHYVPLEQTAVALRSRGELSTAELNDWVERVHLIHEPLAQLEQRFASSMEDYARKLTAFLLGFLAASTAVLLTAGFVVSRRVLHRAGAMAATLQAVQNQVFAEQERAHVLLGSSSDAVISTDRHGTIEFLNTAAERLTGWSATEARGQALENVFRVAQVDSAEDVAIRQAISTVLTEGQGRRLSTYGAELIRRDHSTTSIGERASPLHDRTGDIVGMVLVMRDVTAERQLWEQLRHQADHDALTGLPNRAHFERRLELAMQQSAGERARFTVMFVDLDEFKIVNDTCGHRAGDELLRRIGPCIQEQLRAGDLLARLGGDEFGLLLPDCDISMAAPIAERVRQAVEGLQFDWGGRTFTVKASIGLVLDERAFPGVAAVLGAADRACYAAKKAGRNAVRVYNAAGESGRWRASA